MIFFSTSLLFWVPDLCATHTTSKIGWKMTRSTYDSLSQKCLHLLSLLVVVFTAERESKLPNKHKPLSGSTNEPAKKHSKEQDDKQTKRRVEEVTYQPTN